MRAHSGNSSHGGGGEIGIHDLTAVDVARDLGVVGAGDAEEGASAAEDEALARQAEVVHVPDVGDGVAAGVPEGDLRVAVGAGAGAAVLVRVVGVHVHVVCMWGCWPGEERGRGAVRCRGFQLFFCF